MLAVAAALAGAACDRPARVEPAIGRASGGEPIRITGEGFRLHGGPVVYVGARAAKAVVVHGDRVLTALTPEADVPGVVDVSVRFADGTIVAYPAAYEYSDEGLVLRVDKAR